ncbi:SEL1-like repeat protein [Actinacidiphila acidipaludis]|uniref:Tetratricopeptide repeat protein n=1 Tax=Actinacidiphila acidipaludis TaxID=2873382 RepID=A0ABS7Q4W5_9ACTN|nr:tetratricopeptide repeat protein [Streptomyces acidipaludis]MBY8876809.1 tetratricopeptide repeat protein [Streptomyces acidipaludis]
MEPESEWEAAGSSKPSQSADVHDHGTAFQQNHGVQIYYASRGARSPEELANTAHLLALDRTLRFREYRDPVSFGVHPAATWNQTQFPEYVRRDIDEDLYAVLQPGAFVLLVGDPTSGKSRTAFEAIKSKFPEYLAFRPEDGLEFAECVAFARSRDKVIWLDELDRFLSRPSISTSTLDEALRSGAVLIGTMRADQLDLLSPRHERGHSAEARALVRAARGVTARAHILYIDRQWSDDEVKRASRSKDPRVKDASRYASEYGIAEYLAAGPQLYREWQNAWSPGLHPRGAALVSAAVDLRRAGVREPISKQLLERLHAIYLDKRGGSRLRPESLLDAIHWALEPLHATSSLLIPVGEETYRSFEYLAEAHARDKKDPSLPQEVWDSAVDDFSLEVTHSVGHRAEKAAKYDYASRAYERLASAGISEGSFHLGYISAKRDDLEEAEFWYRKAISQGSLLAKNNLGLVLSRSGREDEASYWFLEAAQEGDGHAMRNLGNYFLVHDQLDEAKELFLSFAQKDSPVAKTVLGRLCIHQDDYRKAEEWLRQAIDEGDNDDAWFFLGVAQEENGDLEAASSSYRQAIRAGNAEAANNLAGVLNQLGEPEEAESLYRERLAQADDKYAAFNLAALLAKNGRANEAEELYRKAIAMGSEYAKNNLALLLEKADRDEEADALFREAAADGDVRAMANLSTRCRKSRDPREALSWINQALASGKPEYYIEMGMVQEALMEPNKAMLWYRRAMDAGQYRGATALGFLYERQGKIKAATRIYAKAAQNGEGHALYHLGQLCLRKRDYEKARTYLVEANKKGEPVSHMLAYLALRDGDPARARELMDSVSYDLTPAYEMVRNMINYDEESTGRRTT